MGHIAVLHAWSSLTHIEPGYETAWTANSCGKHTNTHTQVEIIVASLDPDIIVM